MCFYLLLPLQESRIGPSQYSAYRPTLSRRIPLEMSLMCRSETTAASSRPKQQRTALPMPRIAAPSAHPDGFRSRRIIWDVNHNTFFLLPCGTSPSDWIYGKCNHSRKWDSKQLFFHRNRIRIVAKIRVLQGVLQALVCEEAIRVFLVERLSNPLFEAKNKGVDGEFGRIGRIVEMDLQ